MPATDIRLRPATENDLESINRIIDAAIMTWDLPERVRRLSLSSYHYTPIDLQHYVIIVAVRLGHIVGVIAWDSEPHQVNEKRNGILIHGLYVEPALHRMGIGMRLFRYAEQAVAAAYQDAGLWVKAQKEAEGFYRACGMRKLAVDDLAYDYEHRYWKPLQAQT